MIIDGEFYIPSDALLAGIKKIVLKDDALFAVLDTCGESPRVYGRELGFYMRDTRYLDTWEININGYAATSLMAEPMAKDRAYLFAMTNKDIASLETGKRIPRDRLQIQRLITLYAGQVFEHVQIVNFDSEPHLLEVTRRAGSRFNDVFEVRGSHRAERGIIHEPFLSEDKRLMTLSYVGLNDKAYKTCIWAPDPVSHIQTEGLSVLLAHKVELPPRGRLELRYVIAFDGEPKATLFGEPFATMPMEQHLQLLAALEDQPTLPDTALVSSSNPIVNRAYDRALVDVASLLTDRDGGLYPDAGIPWFCAPFGRDGLITAYQLLPWCPKVAEGVLRYVFTRLGTKYDPFTDEEPGKAFHELRQGEMADTREIPFIPYYGAVDGTPLALILLGEFAAWTGRMDVVARHWEAANAALGWCLAKMRESPHGFVTYKRAQPTGLQNQGWKDSHDSVMHADGSLAEAPIALCEVQGYTFRALRTMASLARKLGRPRLAEEWLSEAESLQERFLARFWDEGRQMIVLALDGRGEPCRVLASNQGHCLWSQILDPERGALVARHLLSIEMFSGHGVRTLGAAETAYNPLSYHNGSIWPHDNSLIAEGLRLYDCQAELLQLATGIFAVLDASDDFRLPELFCGFHKYGQGSPVPYDVACKPQAWAAGSLFLVLKALLGMRADLDDDNLHFMAPVLPSMIDSFEVRNLPFKGQEIDCIVRQGRQSSTVEILRRTGAGSTLVYR